MPKNPRSIRWHSELCRPKYQPLLFNGLDTHRGDKGLEKVAILFLEGHLSQKPSRRSAKISSTTAALLNLADIKPARLNQAIQRKQGLQVGTQLGRRSHHVRKVVDQTGFPVVKFFRQNLSILLFAHFVVNNRGYFYREESQKLCFISLPIEVPESVAVTAIGKPLSYIAQGFGVLDDLDVKSIARGRGMSEIHFNQTWISVD